MKLPTANCQLPTERGFTLVELSIVIVIIGLLIGGILVGQSLIESARIAKTIAVLNQLDIAVDGFVLAYKSLPGDSRRFGGDGIVEVSPTDANGCDTSATSTKFEYERAIFWSSLSTRGLLSGEGKAYLTPPGGVGNANKTGEWFPDTYLPSIPMGKNIAVFACGTPTLQHFFKISSFSTNINGDMESNRASAFKGPEALAIDQKIDDGTPVLGNLRAYDSGNLRLQLLGIGGNFCQGAANAYNTTSSQGICNLELRMGSQTGNLK